MFATLCALATLLSDPVVTWTGPDSRITTPRQTLIQSEADWLALWSEHVGKSGSIVGLSGAEAHARIGAPRINFERHTVVAVFAGRKPGLGGFSARCEETGERYVLTLSELAARDRQRETTAYGLFLIDKQKKPVAIKITLSGSTVTTGGGR